MYKVESKSLQELLDLWHEDYPDQDSAVVSTNTADYQCTIRIEQPIPQDLADRIIQNYLNEHVSSQHVLVACFDSGMYTRFVWRLPEDTSTRTR